MTDANGFDEKAKTFWIYEPNLRRGSWSVWKPDEVNGIKVNENSMRVIDKAAYDRLKDQHEKDRAEIEKWKSETQKWIASSCDDQIKIKHLKDLIVDMMPAVRAVMKPNSKLIDRATKEVGS